MPVPPDLRRGAFGDDLDRLSGGQQATSHEGARVGQPDHRQLLLASASPAWTTRDELTREQPRVTMPAVERAEHEGDVPVAIQRYRSADRPVGARRAATVPASRARVCRSPARGPCHWGYVLPVRTRCTVPRA